VELSHRINHLFIGPLAVLFFSGILLRRAAPGSAMVGFLVATGVSAFISYSKQLFGFEQNISFMWVVPTSFIIGVIATGLVSHLFRPPVEPSVGDLAIETETLQ
jgi:hypothetical protein